VTGWGGPAALLLALAACMPAAGGGASQEAVVGRVVVSGSAPMDVSVVLRAANGSGVRLAGPLLGELTRLAGAEVEVRGAMAEGSLRAASYRVLSVDGRPVLVGTVEADPGGGVRLRTEDGRVVALAGPPAELRAGQKVWVQGPGETRVQVQRFGVISP